MDNSKKINAKDKPFQRDMRVNNPRKKLSKRNSSNKSEKQFIENKAKESSSYKEHKVNALASGAEEGRD